MHTTYFDDDDNLVLRISAKPIVRGMSQDWNTHISYAADSVAFAGRQDNGALPVEIGHGRAA